MSFIDNLTEKEKNTYWWNYGEIGQKIIEKSDELNNLIKKNIKIIDGHLPPEKDKFSNLPFFMHLDIVLCNFQKKKVEAICEVKTTKNQLKKEFNSNGLCSNFMIEAKNKKIPLFFAVVRLKDLLPKEIITKKGYIKVLNSLLKDKSLYKIEFYNEEQFVLEQGVFKIKQKSIEGQTKLKF